MLLLCNGRYEYREYRKYFLTTSLLQEELDSERPSPALISITPATPIGSQSREHLPEAETEKVASPPLQLSQSWTVFGEERERQTCSMAEEGAGRAVMHPFSKSDSHLAVLQPAARVL